MKEESTDFLIIGSGVAGLRAAIEVAPHGKVLIITKDIPTESSTEYAQGGVAVALSDEDEVGIHYEDTIRAGDGLCREEAVRILVEEGPERILELISWGAEFDREGTKLSFTMEAAHTKKRILHAHGDSTGRELERVLLNKVRSFGSVNKYPFAFITDLIISNGDCLGAIVIKKGEKVAIFSRAVILATGGAGQLYERTTNPPVTTGDGMAIAFRAGAILEDMEFVQFHPTSLYIPKMPNFLLSEAMRGEGALLRNAYGETFMKKYHPQAELAPRDIVSRAIISEMVRTKSSFVYLDLTHLDKEFVKKRFPRIYRTCLACGIDITQDRIPVSPAAHYIMGGVKTDIHGRTSIKRLYAAGEVACTGVHGANRLASNSLLEGLVYGARAGRKAVEESTSLMKCKDIENDFGTLQSLDPLTSIDIRDVKASLRRLMWEKVGIIRCAESLSIARDKLVEWEYVLDREFNDREGLELRNMLIVARLITEAAIERKGSVGAHYRSDFPEKDKDWRRHILIRKKEIGLELFRED